MAVRLRYEDIPGNSEIKNHLKNAAKTGRVSHAYLIEGPSGMGKRQLADTFAAALECERGGPQPCMECRTCRRSAGGNLPDLISVTHEKPQLIRVEDIRRQLVSDVLIRPDSRYKVYIIDDAEKMNEAAQNALLKTIEEPPEYAVIILLAVNRSALLPTILSRCICLEMKPVSTAEIIRFLLEKTDIGEEQAKICAAFAQGVPGKALLLAQSEDFVNLKDAVVLLVKQIGGADAAQMEQAIRSVRSSGMEPEDYLDFLAVWYRDLLRFKAAQDADAIVFRNEASEICRQAERVSYHGITVILDALERAKQRLRANVNYDLTMELLLRTIREEVK